MSEQRMRPAPIAVAGIELHPDFVRRSALVNDLLISRLFCEHGQARHLRCDECWRRAFMVVGV